jgi:hypothetical protein
MFLFVGNTIVLNLYMEYAELPVAWYMLYAPSSKEVGSPSCYPFAAAFLL